MMPSGGGGAGRPIPKDYVPRGHEGTAAWKRRKAGWRLRPKEAAEAARSEGAQKSAAGRDPVRWGCVLMGARSAPGSVRGGLPLCGVSPSGDH